MKIKLDDYILEFPDKETEEQPDEEYIDKILLDLRQKLTFYNYTYTILKE